MEYIVLGKRRSNLTIIGSILLVAAILLLLWAINVSDHWTLPLFGVLLLLAAGGLIIQNLVIPEALVASVGNGRILLGFPKRRFALEEVEEITARGINTIVFRMRDGTEHKQKFVGNPQSVIARVKALNEMT